MNKKLILSSLLAMGLAACGGSNNGSDDTERSTLTLALTDAEGDFLQYEVDVEQLQLVNKKGDVVSALPVETRIDFAQYTDLTEILNILTVPAGYYTDAKMLLDFSDAAIVVQDMDGDAIEADAVDSDGNPLTQVWADVQLGRFGNGQGVYFRAGKAAKFTLDFDLDASNNLTIDSEANTAETEVEPVILAEASINTNRDHRIRGLIDSVDEGENSLTVSVRPFRHYQDRPFGTLELTVADDATFEIDKETCVSGCLSQLADMTNEPVVGVGKFQSGSETFELTEVYAGTSVPWSGGEFIKGVITDRDGDLVTVQGVKFKPESSSFVVSNSHQLTLTDALAITRPMTPAEDVSDDNLTVGQRVRFYDEDGSDDEFVASHARLLMNQLRAKVDAADDVEQELTVEVSLFNGRRPGAYEFATVEADADQYLINSGSLTDAADAGDYLKVRGWVNPYDFDTPAKLDNEDFDATTISNLNILSRGAGLRVVWPEDTSDTLVSSDSQSLTLNTATADHAEARFAGFRCDFKDVSCAADQVLVNADTTGIYVIKHKSQQEVIIYLTFSEFESALTDELATEGVHLARINAHGQWDEAEMEFNSDRITAILE